MIDLPVLYVCKEIKKMQDMFTNPPHCREEISTFIFLSMPETNETLIKLQKILLS
jgi:hypothetical protein